jgi:hypothetical protein
MYRLSGKKIGFALVDTAFHSLSQLAVRHSIEQFQPDEILIFSDQLTGWPDGSRVHEIEAIVTKDAYNKFIIEQLPLYATADFYIVLQYDGFVLNGSLWDDAYLVYDYIGAPWPNYEFHRVGNGGFSLRSRRLIHFVSTYSSLRQAGEAEDMFIGRTIRPLLESRHNINFASEMVALKFSLESPGYPINTFGFHGVFNLPLAYRGRIEKLIASAPDYLLKGRRNELAYGARYLDEDERHWFLSELFKE